MIDTTKYERDPPDIFDLDDVMRKIQRCPEIDMIRFGALMSDYVYLTLISSKNGNGFGGLAVENVKFNNLRRKLTGRVKFVDIFSENK